MTKKFALIPVLSLIIFFNDLTSSYASTLPSGLDSSEREQVARNIVSGVHIRSSQLHRSLSFDEGLDIAISFENLPLEQLPPIGTEEQRLDSLNYFRLQVGKGLYQAVDIAISLTPLNSGSPLRNFGGRLRWSFYEKVDSPFTLSTYFEGNNTNLSDQFLLQSLSLGIQIGVKRENLSISFFSGASKIFGRFRGGPEGVTDSATLEALSFVTFPVGLGGVYDMKSWYAGVAVDRHSETVLSAKIGKVF